MTTEQVLVGLDEQIKYNADKISRLATMIQKATKGGLLPDSKVAHDFGGGWKMRSSTLRAKLDRAQRLQKILHGAKDEIKGTKSEVHELVDAFVDAVI